MVMSVTRVCKKEGLEQIRDLYSNNDVVQFVKLRKTALGG